jgi:alkaline phosphatase D
VRWVVGRDEALAQVVQQGDAVAPADADHTVHVDVAQLEPATTYFYAFDHEGTRSPVGRTRTARAADDPGEVRLGVVSCSSFAAGPFSAYRRLAETDVDLVVHLGDYLYDSGEGLRRHDPPGAPVTLDDYRRRHAQQRSDPDLQRLHAALPVSPVWDDHDVAGNAWRGGADDHDPDAHGPWEPRRAAAIRAWLEWLPVRRPDPSAPERIWRNLPLGGAADLLLLDTRHDGRDEQVSADDPDAAAALASPERRLVSEAQEAWLTTTLAGSAAAWRVLGNQVVLTPLGFEVPDALAGSSRALGLTIEGEVVNPDAWDGYPAARERLLEAIATAGPTVVLTGDVHSSWAFEVPGPGDGPVTVEWVTPSVSAEPFSEIVRIPTPALAPAAVDLIAGQLPQIRWAELTQHGFLVASFDAERAQCDWWHVDLDDGQPSVAASWAVDPDDGRLVTAEPLPPRAVAPPPTSPPPAPPGADAGGDGGPSGLTLAGGAAAVCGAAVAGVLALRRRRSR